MTFSRHCIRPAWLAGACLLLAGCGSGGGDSPAPTPANRAPTANAGADRNVVGTDVVQLAGTASDPDSGDTLSYSWRQTSGPSVVLNDATTLMPSFVAPDGSSVPPGAATVVLSGEVKYEFVPPNRSPQCRGLDYASTVERPVRGATVQVLDQSVATTLTFELTVRDRAGATGSDSVTVFVGGVLLSTTSDASGNYSATVPADTEVAVRVRAELKDFGVPGWDVEVRDNTLATELPLSQRPIYVLSGSTFNTGSADLARNLTAATGWDGSAYSAARAAAPFSVLDTVYAAMQAVRGADADVHFPPLDVFWSVNNSTTEGDGDSEANIASGEIGTSFYRSDLDSLFLLGRANDDTEEFDHHVIVHEWGHYFEDVLSRSDSIGGGHGFGDRLDMRVAFGEGWATALSGIALDDPSYCDTQGSRQENGFLINIEGEPPSPAGWYNEFSVMALIYDLWDSDLDVARGDTGSVPFADIYRTMTERQTVTPAHTSIFTFTAGFANESPAGATLAESLRDYHDINGTGIYGAGETNAGGTSPPEDATDVYREITPDGTTLSGVCSNRQHDSNADGNKLAEHRFLRMTITTPARYTFQILTDASTLAEIPEDDPTDERDQSDPDIYFYLNGQVQNRATANQPLGQGLSGEANREVFTTPNTLPAGDYVMDIVEFRHLDEETDTVNFPARSCFDVTIQPAP